VKAVVHPGIDTRSGDDERDSTGEVVGEDVIAVDVALAEVLAVIGRHDDQRILSDAGVREGRDGATEGE
jgi:hypothetical protein